MTDRSPAGRSHRRVRIPPDEPVYVISIAAELTGVHPQTLRGYERAGLIEPARTPGGARRYSADDIDRIRRIQELTDEGVPLIGVARILELERRLAELSRPSTALVRHMASRRNPTTPSAHPTPSSRIHPTSQPPNSPRPPKSPQPPRPPHRQEHRS